MNPYDILGIPKGSSVEDAKKAFRKLAMQYHPDRLSGKSEAEQKEGEEKFKRYKEALEQIENPVQENPFSGFGYKANRSRTGGPSVEDMLREFAEMEKRTTVVRKHVSLNLKAAYEGVRVPLNVGSTSVAFAVPAGVPNGSTIEDQVPVESGTRRVQVTFEIKDPKFTFKYDAEEGFMRGDLETTVDVPAATLLLGGYVVVEDFLGAKLQVRVPAGFNPKHTLKVSKRGYAAWHNPRLSARIPGQTRGDLYVHVNPIRSTIDKMDPAELEAIAAEVQKAIDKISEQPDGKA